MFLNGLQLRLISLSILKLFAFLSPPHHHHHLLLRLSEAGTALQTSKADIKQTHSFGARNSWPICLSLLSPALCFSSSFIIRERGKRLIQFLPLSSSLVDVSQCTQLLSPSLSFGRSDLRGQQPDRLSGERCSRVLIINILNARFSLFVCLFFAAHGGSRGQSFGRALLYASQYGK